MKVFQKSGGGGLNKKKVKKNNRGVVTLKETAKTAVNRS